MKIVYLLDEDINQSSGVIKKINAQIEEWEKYRVEVFVFSIATSKYQKGNTRITNVVKMTNVFANEKLKFSGTIYNMLNKITSVGEIIVKLKEIGPDLIYLREMIAFPGLNKIIKAYPTVIEANTLFINEAKLGNPIRWLMTKLLQPNLYKNAKGFVGVTNEITHQFDKYNGKSVTIANGISFNDEQYTVKKQENDRPQIVFVGTPGMPWHGIDKYYKMAQLIEDADFHLIGPTLDDNCKLNNFFQHGYLQREDLIEQYRAMDIAVGSLALFRNNMNEACVLKVREYLSLGLPVIIGYNDSDLNDLPFILKVENSENGVEDGINEIKDFIFSMKDYVVSREYIEPIISVKIKEKMRIQFIENILM